MELFDDYVFLTSEDEETAFYNHDSNRAVGVVWPAIVENRLADALRAAMRPDDEIAKQIFRPEGPLGTFGSKIQLGYMLGLYGSDFRDDLIKLTKIRNAFAHRVDITEFEVSPVKDWMDSMNVLKIHRGALEEMAKHQTSETEQINRISFHVLSNELVDYRNSFHLIIRFMIHTLVDAERLFKVPKRNFDAVAESKIADLDSVKDLDKQYLTALNKLVTAVENAISTSKACAGLKVSERLGWAAVLFTRLCTTAISMMSLCPASPSNANDRHWDFSAVASLA